MGRNATKTVFALPSKPGEIILLKLIFNNNINHESIEKNKNEELIKKKKLKGIKIKKN